MQLNILIMGAVLATALVLIQPRVAGAKIWRATVTPLASIIGSGFLVLGPILDAGYGGYAPLVMAGLCLAAWAFGDAVRFNIARIARHPGRTPLETRLETAASWALAGAYVVSVTYYLNLFGAFAVSLTPLSGSPVAARLLTSAAILLILGVGWTRGFFALEGLERVSVGIKLCIIAGLLAALVVFFAHKAGGHQLLFNPPERRGWSALTLAFGLIITVQGFETSRYLGEDYDAKTRISSMRWAQIVSAAIYMVYIVLIAYVFRRSELKLEDTAIIGMMGLVAPILPVLLVAAALSAQFSAAIADTSGCGGLVEELTRKRISERHAYAVLAGCALAITWSLDVFQIIAWASRVFAVYYALQSAIAGVGAWRTQRRALGVGFVALSAFALLVAIFGEAAAG